MTKQEFIKEFARLEKYYNQDIKDKEILLMYYTAVQGKSIEQFKKQINEIIQTQKFMPKIADFGCGKKTNFEEREYSTLKVFLYL